MYVFDQILNQADYQINNNSQNLITHCSGIDQMDLIFTPKNKLQYNRFERTKRFMRKPAQKSERSSSKKSGDSSVKEMYIKSPTNVSIKKEKAKQADFFTVLAQSMISKVSESDQKQINRTRPKLRISQNFDTEGSPQYHRYGGDNEQNTKIKNLQTRTKTLEAQIDLKNHQISILTGELQRLKHQIEQEKQKRRKVEVQRKDLTKQLRDMSKANQNLKIEIRKHQKQKQHLMKQIDFLERINYDEKTRSLQSYRQKYLESQLQKVKNQASKSKGQKEKDLENHLRVLKEQKYTIQSHYKAMKIANQCLIKQLNNTQENIHTIILNSEEYKILRDKYIRFLEQYKLLRNEYWSLKAESNKNVDSSSLFSITASQVEDDLSLLKHQPLNQSLDQFKTVKSQNLQTRAVKENIRSSDPSYSFK